MAEASFKPKITKRSSTRQPRSVNQFLRDQEMHMTRTKQRREDTKQRKEDEEAQVRDKVEYVSKHSRDLLARRKSRKSARKNGSVNAMPSRAQSQKALSLKAPRSSGKKSSYRDSFWSDADADFFDINEHGPKKPCQ